MDKLAAGKSDLLNKLQTVSEKANDFATIIESHAQDLTADPDNAEVTAAHLMTAIENFRHNKMR